MSQKSIIKTKTKTKTKQKQKKRKQNKRKENKRKQNKIKEVLLECCLMNDRYTEKEKADANIKYEKV